VGDFSTPLSKTDRSSTPKRNQQKISELNTIDKMDLKGIYRIFYPTDTEYKFLAAHGTFSKKTIFYSLFFIFIK
jgi:phage-related protein